MIAHYFAVAFANVRKAPFVTAANVITLAMGLACFIAAYGVVSWWRSADSYHANAHRIVVVGQRTTADDEDAGPFNSASNSNLGRYLAADFTELEAVARVLTDGDVPVAAGARKALFNVANVDPAFVEIFDFEFVAGQAAQALADPNGVILTKEAATRLFGDAPALGRPVIIAGGSEQAVVTAVIAPIRQPSFMGAGPEARIRFDMIRSYQARFGETERLTSDNWFGFGPLTFAVLPPGLSIDDFNARLPAFLTRRVPETQRQSASFEAQALPINALRTHDLDNTLFARGGPGLSTLAALLGLGVLTLIIACVNYANLATARAASRAKEIGLRKVLGAGRHQVMAQVWVESLLLAGAAAILAFAGLAVVAPIIRSATEIDILYFMSQGIAPFGVIAGLVIGVALAAGAYPALVLSRVRPATALQSGVSGTRSGSMERVLVGVQFASASFLMILVTVTQLQRAYIERTALAPRGEDPVVILNDLMPIDVAFDTLAARLALQPGVHAVSVVDRGPWDMNGDNVMTYGQSPEAGTSAPTGYLKSIGHDYFDALNLRVLAGRVFDRERGDIPATPFAASDSGLPVSVVVDRVYAERLGFRSPEAAVGQTIFPPATFGATAASAQIIGVTETEATRIDASDVAGNIYVYFPRAFFGGQHPIVRIDGGRVADGIAAITRTWDELAPNVPVNIRFFDELFDASFRTYARVGQAFMLLAVAAFVIASIGLLGMAVHATNRRRHEIGVRKTLGSTTTGIARLLLVDFAKPILIANLLAWPLGYLAAETYLSAFAVRVPLTPAPFLLSLAITLLIAWVAVTGEVVKAASLRPVEVLRHA